jgi:hypothetical protein
VRAAVSLLDRHFCCAINNIHTTDVSSVRGINFRLLSPPDRRRPSIGSLCSQQVTAQCFTAAGLVSQQKRGSSKILSACRFWGLTLETGKLERVNLCLGAVLSIALLFIRHSSFVASSDLLFLSLRLYRAARERSPSSAATVQR